MGKGYSLDLRERVVEFVEKGLGDRKKAAEQFSIGQRTVDRWMIRRRQGCLAIGKQGCTNRKKVDRDSFRKYVDKHPDQTLKQIGANFSITDVGALKIMRELNYVYKKNVALRRARRKEACRVS